MSVVHDELPREDQIIELARFAGRIRAGVVRASLQGADGDLRSSLAANDIMTALWFAFLRHTPAFAMWQGRDRLVISDADLLPVWQAALAEAGYGAGEPELPTPEIPPTGEAVAYGVGLAAGLRLDESDARVVVLVREPELLRGDTWEGALLASRWDLSGLLCISLVEGRSPSRLWGVSGFEVREIDGHDWNDILDALEWADERTDSPKALVARVEAGHGVAGLEGNGSPPRQILEQAIQNLIP